MAETQLKPLDLSTLNPPMNITLIQDGSGLKELSKWLAEQPDKVIGLDVETNVTQDFWNRRVRTIQIGDRNAQFIIDLLSFAGTTECLVNSQGMYGFNNGTMYAPIFDLLDGVLCSNTFVKVGSYLAFDYENLKWNFGKRIWNLYCCDLAERVIQAGRISLKKYKEFSMQGTASRYLKVLINKDEQTSFDLSTPLTKSQIEYAALDVRIPLAIRQAQMKILTADHLLATAQIENEAIPTYVDMHLTGQNLDDARWLKRIEHVKAKRIEEVKILDEGFIPIVGTKTTAIDYNELDRLEKIWHEDFELPTQDEINTASAIRLEKDKVKKEELRRILKNQKQLRSQAKAEARSNYSKAHKEKTKNLKILEKCEGKAFINYGSNAQLLEALQKFKGMGHISSVGDEVLIKFNDRPLIQILRKYRAGKKDTGTYGEQWTQRWTTKPCKIEGWRHPGDGRLHCIFNQLEAETGRSSSSKPNAQNLPLENEVRSCFICDPTENGEENCIVTADMDGCELRIIADLAQAKSWINAFKLGQDVHAVSTEILYPEKWPSLTEPNCEYFKLGTDGKYERRKCNCKGHKELRNNTKAINFLICYGGGPDALADQLGVNTDTAKELMKLHEKKFPEVWAYLYRSGEQAKTTGEARDMYGRRRLFTEPTYENAREWVKEFEEEKLELTEEEYETALFAFKSKELREPKDNEIWSLKHREPTDKEIRQGMRAMHSSIGRRGKNHRIQGTNASIIKRSLGSGFDASGKPYLWHTLPQYKAKIQNMIHDELVVHCPKKYGKEVAELVGDAFKRAAAEVMKNVKMEFDYHISNRWQK